MSEINLKNRPSIHWRIDTTLKYLHNDEVFQLILVQGSGGSNCKVMMFEKNIEDGPSGTPARTTWTEILNTTGFVGMAGLGKEKEGDNKTPIGDFGVTTAFGLKENPGTTLPYVDITEDLYCCADEEFYNQIIDIKEHPHECTGEHLIDYTPEYNYGFFPDYNKTNTFGRGSAIFFHCTGGNPYTGGCIAVKEEDMVFILRHLHQGARVIIDYMP